MGDWTPTKLADLIEIKHGFAFEGKFFAETLPGDLLLSPGNFGICGGFQLGKKKFYRGPVPEEYILSAGDLIVTMTDLSKEADTLGYSAIVPDLDDRMLHNQRLGKVTLKNNRSTKSFVHWVMRSRDYRNEILASCTGSTVKHTSPSKILAYEFLLPTPEEQENISSFLDALESKTALNRSMNQTLELMLQSAFKDWFLNFGPIKTRLMSENSYLSSGILDMFPSSFDAKGVPNGWTAGQLEDVVESVGEIIDPSDVDAMTPYIGLEHMPRRSMVLDSWSYSRGVTSSKLTFKKGDILFGKLRPYFHKVGIAPIDGICSTDIVVLRPKKANAAAFSIACVSSDNFVAYTDRHSSGTKMPRTSWGQMARYPLTIPSANVLDKFQSVFSPFIQRVLGNVKESRDAAQLRDLVLPKLLSGEITFKRAIASAEGTL